MRHETNDRKSGIIQLLKSPKRLNLAESTCRDLNLKDVLGGSGVEDIPYLALGYGSIYGDHVFISEIAKLFRVQEAGLLTTSGAAMGIYLCIKQLETACGNCVATTPGYPPTLSVLSQSCLEVRAVELRFENRFELKAEAVSEKIDENTRLVAICSPLNPSGTIVSEREVAKILSAVDANCPNAKVLIDEIYLLASLQTESRLASFAGRHRNIVTVSSVSKALGAPGLRAGWLYTDDCDFREALAVV